MAQNSKNLRLNGHTSFEFQTRNYICKTLHNVTPNQTTEQN